MTPFGDSSQTTFDSARLLFRALCYRRSIPPPQQIIQKRPCHHLQLPPRRVDGVPVAQNGKALDVEHGELAGLVEGEGVAGEGGDAEPGEDGLLDGFVTAQFQARADVEILPG